MLFAEAHGWDRLIDAMTNPTTLMLIAGFITTWIVQWRNSVKIGTVKDDVGDVKVATVEGNRMIDGIKSDTKDAKVTATAAIVMAKNSKNQVVDTTNAILEKISQVAEQTNGNQVRAEKANFDHGYNKGLSETVAGMSERIIHLEKGHEELKQGHDEIKAGLNKIAKAVGAV